MAGTFEDDDDFDFGGDVMATDFEARGTKRPLDEDSGFASPLKKSFGAAGDEHATTTILNLRASLEEKDAAIASVQSKLDSANAELERWRSAFRDSPILPGLGARPDPTIVLQAVLKLQASDCKLREHLQAAKRKENGMLVKLSNKDHEISELKVKLQDMRAMMQPVQTQARKLLLDPILHLEFTRMRSELEAAEKKLKEAQDDLAAVQFTPHSKHGKMLMAKCKTLQEENEELGRQASEGKVSSADDLRPIRHDRVEGLCGALQMHELENKLAMQKQLNAELKLGYKELQEYVEDINDEAERLQHVVYNLQQQLQQRDNEKNLSRQNGSGKRSVAKGDGTESRREARVKEEERADGGHKDAKSRPPLKEDEKRT